MREAHHVLLSLGVHGGQRRKAGVCVLVQESGPSEVLDLGRWLLDLKQGLTLNLHSSEILFLSRFQNREGCQTAFPRLLCIHRSPGGTHLGLLLSAEGLHICNGFSVASEETETFFGKG